MPNTDSTKIPGPLYAAAGAGDIVIEGLRKVPARVAKLQGRLQTELPGQVNVLQDRVTQKVAELPSIVAELRQRVVDTDRDRLRESARRNAATFRTNAQAAQERATAIYNDLVTRGEQVVARSNGHLDVVRAEVVAAPAKAKDAASAAKGEVLEGDLTGEPRKPAKKTAKKAAKKAAPKS
jgi:hypothetical protein